MISDCFNSVPEGWQCERRSDGAVLVRVPSRRDAALPDAVFTFRHGDPQYGFWEQQLVRKENAERQLSGSVDTSDVDRRS